MSLWTDFLNLLKSLRWFLNVIHMPEVHKAHQYDLNMFSLPCMNHKNIQLNNKKWLNCVNYTSFFK